MNVGSLMQLSHKAACSTVARRAAMTAYLTETLTKAGATLEECIVRNETRETILTFAIGDYRVNVDFDSMCKAGAFMAHWYTASHSIVRYPVDFPCANMNQYHKAKATVIENDFASLVITLRRGFRKLAALTSETA